jgi:DNA-binding LacI/PurR family transcriptional regulator
MKFDVSDNRNQGIHLKLLIALALNTTQSLIFVVTLISIQQNLRCNHFCAAKKLPTAIFVTLMKWHSVRLKAIRERGMRIPEDISVIGFDDH